MPCTSSKSAKYLVAQEMFAEWYLVSLWRPFPLSCFQTWFTNSQAQINQFWSSVENLEGVSTLFFTFLYFSLVTLSHCWGLLSMYLLGDRHGYVGQGWTINHFYLYPEGCLGLHYMTAHAIALISKLPASHPREEGPTGKLYLTSILQTVCIPLTLGIPVLGAAIPQVRGSQMILRIGSPKVTAGQEWQASIEIKRGTKPLLPRIANRIVPVIIRAASPFTRLFIQQA